MLFSLILTIVTHGACSRYCRHPPYIHFVPRAPRADRASAHLWRTHSVLLWDLELDRSVDLTPLTVVIIIPGKSRSKPISTRHTRATGMGSGMIILSAENVEFLFGARREAFSLYLAGHKLGSNVAPITSSHHTEAKNPMRKLTP